MLLNYIGNLGRWGVRRINAIGRATIMLFYSDILLQRHVRSHWRLADGIFCREQ